MKISSQKENKYIIIYYKNCEIGEDGITDIIFNAEELEKFLVASLNTVAKSLNDMTSGKAIITKRNKINTTGLVQDTKAPDTLVISVTCMNSVIAEISMSWNNVELACCISQKAMNFVNQNAKEIDMSA